MDYRSSTLRHDNRQRLLFLPCFPHSLDDKQDELTLLLSNVPGKLIFLSEIAM